MSESEHTEVKLFVGPWVDTAEFADRLRQAQSEGGPVDLQELAWELAAEEQQ